MGGQIWSRFCRDRLLVKLKQGGPIVVKRSKGPGHLVGAASNTPMVSEGWPVINIYPSCCHCAAYVST